MTCILIRQADIGWRIIFAVDVLLRVAPDLPLAWSIAAGRFHALSVLSYDKLEEIFTRIFSLRPADKSAGEDFRASFWK